MECIDEHDSLSRAASFHCSAWHWQSFVPRFVPDRFPHPHHEQSKPQVIVPYFPLMSVTLMLNLNLKILRLPLQSALSFGDPDFLADGIRAT